MSPTAQARGLRVLLATPRYFPYTGGTETHVYEVGRRLVGAGADVTVLTADPSGQLPPVEESEGMHIRRVRAWPATGDLYFAPGMYNAVAHGPWDIVHCQGVHTLVAPLVMLAAWRAKMPYVVTFHTGGHSSRLRTALRGLQWALLRPLLARAERLIGVSRFEADKFRRQLDLPERQFELIRNGGRLPEVTVTEPATQDGKDTLIVSVGRLERYKGHQRIIAALPKVRERYPDVRLRIAGAGPYEAPLRSLARDLGVADCVQIEAIPPSDRHGMARVLTSAALVTLLSEYEAHPVAMIEALALRRPVLVAETSGLRELAEQGLVRAIPLESTADEVAAAVMEQLRHPLVHSHMTLPTWDDCAADLMTLYRSVTREATCAS
jgi:glycosyltransferase involved in cell wall biosynthesis